MKKATFIITFLIMTFSVFSQDDWFGFNRYKADNELIIKSGEFPEVVFMGNSITELWAAYHPTFFSGHNYCGRGIGGQTSTQMLARFTADVINLRPKAVVIMAGTNDVAQNIYWVEPDKVVDNVVAMCLLARASGIVPIISSIPPCAAFRWNTDIKNAAQTIVDINKRLSWRARRRQPPTAQAAGASRGSAPERDRRRGKGGMQRRPRSPRAQRTPPRRPTAATAQGRRL